MSCAVRGHHRPGGIDNADRRRLATTFAENARRRRIELRLTIVELAAKSGASVNAVKAAEEGTSPPSLAVAQCIVQGLETTFEALLTPRSLSPVSLAERLDDN